jgi:DNA processing protein
VRTQRSDEELAFGLALLAADHVSIRGFYHKRTEFGNIEAAFLHAVPPDKQRALLDEARQAIKDARDLSVVVVAEEDAWYPESLRSLRDAPPYLFTLGDVSLLERPAVAIVGTRSATPYGLRITRTLSSALARAGVVVVSGMARGIDAAAHEAALDAGGGTIAVLGTGVDVPYPKYNKPLHSRLAQSGLIVSELSCGTRAFPGSFPRRNRLIAALGRAVIVTEAPVKSGALITSSVALDIGRDVAVVPGNIDTPAGAGSNELLLHGATPILNVSQALSLGGVAVPADSAAPSRNAKELGDDAQLLWRALSASGPLSADALARAGGLEARRAGPALAALEIAGWVEIDHAGVVFAT